MSTLCTATTKHGVRCGNFAQRKGLCLYHQPEEVIRGLLLQLDRNERQRQVIVTKLQAAHNGSRSK